MNDFSRCQYVFFLFFSSMQGERMWASRALAAEELRLLQGEMGLHVRIGVEVEFCFVTGDGCLEDVTEAEHAMAYVRQKDLCEELRQQLQLEQIVVECFTDEVGPAQYELVVAHRAHLEAIDWYYRIIFLLQTLAPRHQCHISLAPRVQAPGSEPNGLHIHLSLWRGADSNVFIHQRGLAKSFIAGVLHHLPALCWAACDGLRTAKALRCWSHEKTSWAPVRLLDDNVEFRYPDHTGDLFLAVAQLVRCGRMAMLQGMQLGPPDGEEEAEMLPLTREEAWKALQEDNLLRVILEDRDEKL